MMAETAKAATPAVEQAPGRRKEVVGEVVANKMSKTIVVQVTRKKAHPFYGRVVARNKKFYAHDEKREAKQGDTVRIVSVRPLSRLKRWRLKEVLTPKASAK